MPWLLCAVCWAVFSVSEPVQAQNRPSLHILPRDSSGWFRMEAPGQTEKVYVLEASSDLRKWVPIARTHDGLFPFSDPHSARQPFRFYRILELPRTANDDWKNQIQSPEDSFLSPYTGSPADAIRWVKFAILLSDTNRVYYQDSTKYPFHYDFAVKRLDPFLGWSRTAFDEAALRVNGQQVVVGAVLFSPLGSASEYGIQLEGLDPYPKEATVNLFELVRSTVAAGPQVQAFYIPTFEQSRAAESERAFFASKGIALSTLDRWLPGDQIYSLGWALGRLKFARQQSYGSFVGSTENLLPADIKYFGGKAANFGLLRQSVPSNSPVAIALSFDLWDAFLNQSLASGKSELALQTRNVRLTDAALAQSIYTQARLTYLEGTEVKALQGLLPAFPGAAYDRKDDLLTDKWTVGTGADQRRYSLSTELYRTVRSPESVLLTLNDFLVRMSVDFASPLPALDLNGQPITTTRHEVRLQPAFPANAPAAPVNRTFRGANGLEIQTRYLWHQPNTGGILQKTAPLLRFEETKITGLTTNPIVLRDYYSQTYRPGHHNFTEEFIFEPGLEATLGADQRGELKAANTQLIYIHWGEEFVNIQALGWDGKFRSLGGQTPPKPTRPSEMERPTEFSR